MSEYGTAGILRREGVESRVGGKRWCKVRGMRGGVERARCGVKSVEGSGHDARFGSFAIGRRAYARSMGNAME